MAFIVELVPEQLHVLPIHRLLSHIDPGVDVLAALDPWFEAFDAGPLDGAPTISARMADAGALAPCAPTACGCYARDPARSRASTISTRAASKPR